MNLFLRAVLGWIPMVFIAAANGAARDLTYGGLMAEQQANQVSVLTGIALFAVYIRLLVRRWKQPSAGAAIRVGAIWLALTVAFESVFGHYLEGRSWEELLHDYNLFAGRLWPLVLAWVAAPPWVFYKLEKGGRA